MRWNHLLCSKRRKISKKNKSSEIENIYCILWNIVYWQRTHTKHLHLLVLRFLVFPSCTQTQTRSHTHTHTGLGFTSTAEFRASWKIIAWQISKRLSIRLHSTVAIHFHCTKRAHGSRWILETLNCQRNAHKKLRENTNKSNWLWTVSRGNI